MKGNHTEKVFIDAENRNYPIAVLISISVFFISRIRCFTFELICLYVRQCFGMFG